MNKHPREHGTLRSYVTGFLLSLLFTAIPYYMVVNHMATGTALLATIMVFAVLQMLVQVLFFLHLGRGPKPLYNVAFYVATVGAILVVTVGSVFIMSNLHARMSPSDITRKLAQDEAISQIGGEETGACQGNNASHRVVISGSRVDTPVIEARRCDTLTFISQDMAAREITFGPHPSHGVYGGESEITVTSRRSETITLNETGTFMFHDHLDPAVSGRFTVLP